MRRLWRHLGLGVAFLTCARLASAETASPPLQIHWSAPPSCPAEWEIERDVAQTIGGRPTGKEPLEARVDVWQSEAGGWKAALELALAGQVTKRQVRGDTCRAVANAVTLVISVAAIQDLAAVAASPTGGVMDAETPPLPLPAPSPPKPATFPAGIPRAPVPTPPPTSPKPSDLVLEPVPAPRVLVVERQPTPSFVTEAPPNGARREGSAFPPLLRFSLGAAALVDVGSVPQAAPGVQGFAAWRPSWWRVEVVGSYLGSTSADATGGRGVTVSRAEASARACGTWGTKTFEAGPCLGAGAVWLYGSGRGATTNTSADVETASGTAGGRVLAHVTRHLALFLGADLVAPFHRPTFEITNFGGVYTPSAVAFRGAFGVEAQL